jgi:hypothetical protein
MDGVARKGTINSRGTSPPTELGMHSGAPLG